MRPLTGLFGWRRSCAVAALAAVGLVPATPVSSSEPVVSGAPSPEAAAGPKAVAGGCASCRRARADHGWCDACGVGYVGGVEIRSKHLWHVLDAHGHQLEVENLGCDGCVAAFGSDGFCTESKVGFVDGDAYFSRLTWLLAKADEQPLESLACPTCRDNHARGGWCERCGVGRVGVYALDERKQFEDLRRDLEILAKANEASRRCERCAAAIVTDTQCPFCRITYRDGQPLSRPDGD